MRLVITIDTEEDNWGGYAAGAITLANILKIPVLQDLFDKFNVKPTYLITYPVATDDQSLAILRNIRETDRCEIGTHCHPWNTPPDEEEKTENNSMLCNLSPELQYRKLGVLHETIKSNVGISPVSFRAGRWGYSTAVAKNLHLLGYKIDTSISSYTDWTACHGPDFSDASPKSYRFSLENIFRESSEGQMVEIPATVGFFQKNFGVSNAVFNMLRKKPVNKLRLIGILSRLHLLNKVWLSPELSDSNNMIKLTRCLMKNNYQIINMSFHSTSLKAGLSPFVRSEEDEKDFLLRIADYLSFVKAAGIESITLSEAMGQFN